MKRHLLVMKLENFVQLRSFLENKRRWSNCQKYNDKIEQDLERTSILGLFNRLVFFIMLYSAETCILKKIDRKRIDNFETWCWEKDFENYVNSKNIQINRY